jgi:16S rRNA (cytidine1402-2'-O)-methyltransferase
MKALEQMKDLDAGERIVSVSREITKIHEETVTDTVNNVIEYYKTHPIKGEIVLLIAGKNYVLQDEKG